MNLRSIVHSLRAAILLIAVTGCETHSGAGRGVHNKETADYGQAVLPASREKAQQSKNLRLDPSLRGKAMSDIIGSAHVAGLYHFSSDKDFLNEGADALLAMGTRVIKLWFYNGVETPEDKYPFNSQWPKAASLVEGAQTPYWRELFNKPFTTYILNTMAMGEPHYYWVHGITDAQAREEERQMYELAKFFLGEYRGSGKTFILANHETDWHMKPTPGPQYETPPEVFPRAIKWFQARQRGVERARADVGMHGVSVFHAGEVVNVVASMEKGQKNMVTEVLPQVRFDLISYSAYDASIYGGIQDPANLKKALEYIKAHTLPGEHFGEKNIFIGEFGLPEMDYSDKDQKRSVRDVVETGLEWGCPYIVYWQIYCNEAKAGCKPPFKGNQDFRGFWLIRFDGSRTSTYDYFENLLKSRNRAH